MYVLRIPSRYMRKDATADEVAIYDYYKQLLQDLQAGRQSGVILPSDRDPESRALLFELDWIVDTDKL